MVVFLDLAEDGPDDPHIYGDGPLAGQFSSPRLPFVQTLMTDEREKGKDKEERIDPNLNITTKALGCYPIIHQITHNIDLNTLHALARTCRQTRSNLLQFHSSLMQSTLHCSNESTGNILLSPIGYPSQPPWHFLSEPGQLVSGKVSICARDLVSDCWRCGNIICRNCTIKPAQAPRLPSRHRRLCPTCLTSPLGLLEATEELCSCPERTHLCAPCGTKLVNADTTYKRVWTWRTRYTTYLGGLGTGIGEGNEGVKCARGKECLGAKDVEVEFECPSSSGSEGSDPGEGAGGIPRVATPGTPSVEMEEKAGYWRQEVEGLGGVVKKKFRKRERVGRTVKEWEDEREGKGDILGREKNGLCRSWCGWCGKVVLGGSDLKNGEEGDAKWSRLDDEEVPNRVCRLELKAA